MSNAPHSIDLKMYSKFKKKSSALEFFTLLASVVYAGVGVSDGMGYIMPLIIGMILTHESGSGVMILLSTTLLASNVVEGKNISDDDPNADPDIDCGNGVMIPIWRAHKDITMGERVGRGLIYALILMYLFVGIAQEPQNDKTR